MAAKKPTRADEIAALAVLANIGKSRFSGIGDVLETARKANADAAASLKAILDDMPPVDGPVPADRSNIENWYNQFNSFASQVEQSQNTLTAVLGQYGSTEDTAE